MYFTLKIFCKEMSTSCAIGCDKGAYLQLHFVHWYKVFLVMCLLVLYVSALASFLNSHFGVR